MTSFSTTELADMQAAQEAHMMDTCVIGRFTEGSTDIYGSAVPTWPEDDAISCGFMVLSVDEELGATRTPVGDAQVRLPIGTTLDPRDRIKVTHRHGVAVTAQAYALVGDPKRGPSGLVVNLERVSDGSSTG